MNWVNAVVQGILLGGLYALFACGLSVMFGVMRVVNLAHGDFAVIAAFLASSLMLTTHMNALWATLLVVPLFAALGYLAQRTLLERSLRAGPLATLLVTFGASVVIQQLLQRVYTADPRALDVGGLIRASLRISDRLSVGYLPLITFCLAVLVLGGLHLLFGRTPLGRIIRATSDDPETARLVGADSRHVYAVATAIAFGTVALAGLLFGMRSSFDAHAGPTQLIFAFEAVIIGGLGSLWGTFAGGIVLGIAQTVAAEVDSSLYMLTGHLIFLAVLAFRPRGLVPARST